MLVSAAGTVAAFKTAPIVLEARQREVGARPMEISQGAQNEAPRACSTCAKALFEEVAAALGNSNRRWSQRRVRAFQRALRAARTELCYSEKELALTLGYYGPHAVRLYEGQYPSHPLRPPSRRFLERLAAFLEKDPAPLPPWAPIIRTDPEQAAIPLGRILAAKRQCPECVAEWLRHQRTEHETWWVFGHPSRRFCSERHRRRWHRRDEQERQRVREIMRQAEEDGPR